jgi:hypothetical protein
MKILVCGSRHWDDIETIARVLEGLPKSGVTIIHGAARGADMIAGEVAKQFGWNVREYPAQWDKHGKAAGPLRNQLMLDRENLRDNPIELCIAFHDELHKQEGGTYDMVRRSAALGIPVRNVRSSNDSTNNTLHQ